MCDNGFDGGFSLPNNTFNNTIGVGDVVSPGQNSNNMGSGDIFFDTFKPAKKKSSPMNDNSSKKGNNPFDMSPRPLFVPSSSK